MRRIKVITGIVASVAIFSAVLFSELAPERVSQSKASKKKHAKKSIVVNGTRYDGPEKMIYLQNALRAGQKDLNEPLKYPQYPTFYKQNELKKARQTSSSAKSQFATIFTERGPANVPGRTRSIIVDPEDATQNTWFAANVSGGIWRTDDAGQNWTELTANLDGMAFVTLAMSESNPQVIYAGTGEGFIQAGTFILNGSGIYKSTNKGDTWTVLESTVNDDFTNVSRIIVDPTDENILIAGTSSRKNFGSGSANTGKIMRSVDGGATWTEVQSTAGSVLQVIAAPSDFNTQYASILDVGVLKSTDAGETWSSLSSGLNLDGRMELAVSFSDPDKIYGSALGDASGSGSDLYLNTGSQWQLVDVLVNGSAVDFLGGQGWYDNTILVNPYNDDQVWFGGVGLWSVTLNPDENTSSSLGSDVTITGDVYGSFGGLNQFINWETDLHPDQHYMTAILTDPANEEFRILLGNDGGIFATNVGTNPGNTEGDWIKSGQNYNTTQFYGADKIAGTESYLGGTQDNGTWLSPINETADLTTDYRFIIGGDGFEVVAHYTDPNKSIGGSQFNGFRASDDGWQTAYTATSGLTGSAPFVSRLSSPFHDPDVLYTITSFGVFKSSDFGRSWEGTEITGDFGFWSGVDVEVSKADPRIVWAGGAMNSTSDLFVSEDGGETFNPVNKFADLGVCSGIYSHPTEPHTAFALFSVYNQAKILRTTDLGQTWEDLSGFSASSDATGFPDVATFAVQAMPYDNNVIWAGTEIGIFETTDGAQTWHFVEGFPAVTVWDFIIKDGQLIIGTHGRGIWTADIPELEDYEIPFVLLAPEISDVQRSFLNYNLDITLQLKNEYDSVEFYVNGNLETTLRTDLTIGSTDISFNPGEAGTFELSAIGYFDGDSEVSLSETITLNELIAAVNSISTQFENEENSHWTLTGWTIAEQDGFEDKILSTDHPYPDESTLIAQWNVPITINSEESILKFDEVVEVENGERGTEFGDFEFWDYVIVEASEDGVTWVQLLDGYDARDNDAWSGSATEANSSQFAERQINLLDTYSGGETIIIRFSLVSDAAVNAWGWGIDNLQVQYEEADNDNDGFGEFSDCDDNDPNVYPGAEEIPNNDIDEDCDGSDLIVNNVENTEIQVTAFPNPGKNTVTINTNSNQAGFGRVITAAGQVVMTFDMNSSTKTIDIAKLNRGMYVIQITSGEQIVTTRLIKE